MTTLGYYTDLEGPGITIDHAAELIPKDLKDFGILKNIREPQIFRKLSLYDDIKFFIEQESGYNPGNTLNLIAPILHSLDKDENYLIQKAKELEKYRFYIRGAREVAASVPIRIISTSYCQFVHYVTDKDHLNVDKENVYCTYFPLNELSNDVVEDDKKIVRKDLLELIGEANLDLGEVLNKKIRTLKSLDERKKLGFSDLPIKSMKSFREIEHIFSVLKKSSYSKFFEVVKPCGGVEKYNALCRALEKDDNTLDRAFVVGDSITDCVMLDETKKAGGLAVSFNGNRYCMLSAEIAIFSENCYVTQFLYELFVDKGKEAVLDLVDNWGPASVGETFGEDKFKLLESKHPIMHGKTIFRFPLVFRLTDKNREKIIKEYENFRELIRGKTFGGLG